MLLNRNQHAKFFQLPQDQWNMDATRGILTRAYSLNNGKLYLHMDSPFIPKWLSSLRNPFTFMLPQ